MLISSSAKALPAELIALYLADFSPSVVLYITYAMRPDGAAQFLLFGHKYHLAPSTQPRLHEMRGA
jgi:hypothetical protein